jgi:hypothetical protein
MIRQTYKQKQAKDLEKYREEVEAMNQEKLETNFEPLHLPENYWKDLPLIEWHLEDFSPPKIFNSWQEALLDQAETAEAETLERAAAAARRILKALPIKERTQREKLLRDHLKTLSEFSDVI